MELALNVLMRMREMASDLWVTEAVHYIDSAWEFNNQMVGRGLKPNAVAYNIMISGYCRNNRLACALKLLDVMLRRGLAPNLRCYTAVITTLCKDNKLVEADQLFDKMLKRGLLPDHVMFTSLMNNLLEGHESTIIIKTLQALAKADCNFDVSKLSRPFGYSASETLEQQARLIFDEILRSKVLPVDLVFNIMISTLCTDPKFSVACHLMDKTQCYSSMLCRLGELFLALLLIPLL